MRAMSKTRQARLELENAVRLIESILGPVKVGETLSNRDLRRLERPALSDGEGVKRIMPFDFSRYKTSSEDFENRPMIKGADKDALIEAGTTLTIQAIRNNVPTQYGERSFLDVLVKGQEMTLAFGYGPKGFARRDALLDDLSTHIEETGETVNVKLVKWGDRAIGIEEA